MSTYDNASRSIDPTTQLIYSRTPLPILEQHVLETFSLLTNTNNTTPTKQYLTRHDLKCAIILLLGYTPSTLELNTLLTAAGCTPHSQQRLTADRFVPLLTRRIQQQDVLHHYQQLFASFDSEGKGFIRRDDFMGVCERVVVGGVGGGGRDEFGKLFDVCDVDGDGVVSYREFDRLMSNRPYATM